MTGVAVGERTSWFRRVAPLHREMGLVGGTLFCSGAALVMIDLVTPPNDYVARDWVWAVAVGALLAGVFYFWSARYLPMPIWGYAIGTSVGAVMVTVLVLAGGPQRTAVFGVLYVFVSTYGFYYYGPAISWWLVGLNGVGFAIGLGVHDVDGAVSQWSMIVGTSAIAGGLTGSLSQRVRRLLAQEQATVESLSEVDEWKTTFLQAVAHDLRSPLSSVIGMLDTALAIGDELPSEERRVLLERAHDGSERLRRLLEDLLDVERIAAGAIEPEREEVRLDDLVRTAVGQIDLDDREVELDLAPVVAFVEPSRVERIVTNLVRNAVTHTATGVPVWVRVRARGDHLELVVEDAGPGIQDGAHGDVFEAFRRAGSTTAEGSGLGLHLVRRFTELHGGSVHVTDRPGGGARFVVRLPPRDPREAASESASPVA